MLRITKLTDYAVVAMAELAEHGPLAARDVATRTSIPLPTISKVLKQLAKGGLVRSVRGKHGGYRLSGTPEEVCLTDVIDAVEGRLGITECSTGGVSCDREGCCSVEASWMRVNDVVRRALARITLAEMTRPMHTLVTLGRGGSGGTPGPHAPRAATRSRTTRIG